jgi:hypothetical protein
LKTTREEDRVPIESAGGARLVQLLVALGVASLVAELFVHKHVEFDFQGWFGFDGFGGFLVMVVLALAARILQRFLMRPEDYYD